MSPVDREAWIEIVFQMTDTEAEEVCRLGPLLPPGSPVPRYPPTSAFLHYQAMRIAGQSHSIALLLASRRFPGIRTDATFNIGRCNGNQFEQVPLQGDHYKRIAEAAGVSTTGKHYAAGLADYPGDPTAWIDGRGDVLRIAEAKGYSVSGAVDYRAPERAPLPDIAIADDLVEAEVNERLAADPGARREDVRERVVAIRTGAVDPNPLRVTDHNFEDMEDPCT